MATVQGMSFVGKGLAIGGLLACLMHRRRLFRFRLRSLFLLMTVAAGLAWFKHSTDRANLVEYRRGYLEGVRLAGEIDLTACFAPPQTAADRGFHEGYHDMIHIEFQNPDRARQVMNLLSTEFQSETAAFIKVRHAIDN